MTAPEIIWRPSPDFLENSNIARFMQRQGFSDYRAFHAWSVEDLPRFWNAVLEDMGVEWFRPYDQVLDLSGGFPWAKWFLGGEINVVHNCIDRHAGGDRKDRLALIWEGDGGEVRRLTYADLSAGAGRLANAMRAAGMKAGDTAGIYMPLLPETALAMFACLKMGVTALPIFSGFGPEAVAERLTHAGARLLFTADGVYRRGKEISIKKTIDAALALGTPVEKVVVYPRLGGGGAMQAGRDVPWAEFIENQPAEAETVRLPSEATALIMYTSGTTGKPKGVLLTHAGLLTGPARDVRYSMDLREGDTLFWFTDIGWIMGPWELIGTLFGGGTCFLYEGTPNWPDPGRVWKLAADHRITQLGISPTVVRLLIGMGEEWVKKHDLSSLRLLGSTGEPWDPESYMWYFEKVGGRRCPVMNLSGGTEIGACLLQPVPVIELAPCSLGMPPLGTVCDVYDENRKPVRGAVGHLVLKQPLPSLTKGFLNENERYLETYFSRWPGVWYHGDWAKCDEGGQWYLLGRSDDTILVAGKRVGPPEIEAELIKHPAVIEAAVIGTPHPIKGEGITCFVVLGEGHMPSDALREELKDQAVNYLGKSLRPDEVKFALALPKTRSQKIVRGAIKEIYLGKEVSIDTSALDVPENLEAIKEAV